MKKVLKTLLYIIGFPALVALVALNSLTVYEEGGTYGFWPFVGLILAGVIAIVYTIIFIVTGKNSKKNRGNYNKVKKSVATLVVMSFVLTSGIWLVVDIVLPGILETATQGTRKFEQLHEDYNAQAELHGNLLDSFIEMNVRNGNLSTDEHSLEEWVELGYTSPEVQTLLKKNFTAMDANGYKTFTTNGPWLNMANDGRLTIPVLVHLLLNEREVNEEITYQLVAEVVPKTFITDADGDKVYEDAIPNEEVETVLRWTILDMQGTAMNMDLSGVIGGLGIDVGGLITSMKLDTTLASVLETVNEALADPALAGAEIYIGLDTRDGGFQIMLTPAAEGRGMHGYQNSAWLDSNNLLFAVISIFPARQWLYIWGAIVIFSSVAVAALRLKEYGGDKKALVAIDDDEDVYYDTEGMNKYERTVVGALNARKKAK